MTISLYKQGNKVEDLNVFTYSDSIPAVKSQDYSKVYKADTMVITGNSLTEFFAAMALMDNAFRSSLTTLVLPFVPGARQDRVNPTGDILPTLQYVNKLINKAGFEHVVILDPHSMACGQITALDDNSAELRDKYIGTELDMLQTVWENGVFTKPLIGFAEVRRNAGF